MWVQGIETGPFERTSALTTEPTLQPQKVLVDVCGGVLPAHLSTTFKQCPQWPEEGVMFHGTGVTEGC